MQRRSWLKLGLAGATVLAVGGGIAVAVGERGLEAGKLSSSGRAVVRAVGMAILDGSLPADRAARTAALDAFLNRVDVLVMGLPAHAQQELSQLLTVLASRPGRRWLAGLDGDWETASVDSLQRALQSMRTSGSTLRQQAYHGLHDVAGAAYFADSSTWPLLGYPGPLPVGAA